MSADLLQGDYVKRNKYTWLETWREILDEVSKNGRSLHAFVNQHLDKCGLKTRLRSSAGFTLC